MYSMDDVQDMISTIKRDKALGDKFNALLTEVNDNDARAIKRVISEGWYEEFYRYDSCVMDEFIGLYLQVA